MASLDRAPKPFGIDVEAGRLTAKLGIVYPIIQGPLGGLSSQRLTAAVSNFGGMGSFGAHSLAPDTIEEVIAQIRALTAKPFAMNLWVSMEDEGARTSDESAFNRSLAPLAGYLAELGAPRPAYVPYSPARFDDQVRVVLDANVPVFSFIFGVPPRDVLDECRNKGIVTIGTATTPEEAAVLADAGVDAVVASGLEAGGHRGSFLRSAEDSLTGTMSLVPESWTPSTCRLLPPEVSQMRGASSPHWRSVRTPSRSARHFWPARNPARVAFIAKLCAERTRDTPD